MYTTTTAATTNLGASNCFSASMCSLSTPAPSLRSTLISATRTLTNFINPTTRRTRRSNRAAAASARRRRLLNPAVANPLATEEDWENQRARAALYGHGYEGSETWLAVGAPEEEEQERGWEAVDLEAVRRQMARSRENLMMRREEVERGRRGGRAVRAVWV